MASKSSAMGAEHRNSRKISFACQSVASGAMAKPKAKPTSGPFGADDQHSSLWLYSVVISLVLLVAALALLDYNWKSSALTHAGGERDDVDKEFRVFGYKIVKEYPHDPSAFTQVHEHFFLRRMLIMCE